MQDRETRALLAEALLFFNDHPSFGLRRDPRRTSCELASRIDAHLAHWADEPHPAIAVARDRWRVTDFLRVDDDERCVEREADGYWVRAWIRIGFGSIGEADPLLADRYRRAVEALPDATRTIFLSHVQGGETYRQIANRLHIPVEVVERHVADALVMISHCVGDHRAEP